MKLLTTLALVLAVAATPACKKKEGTSTEAPTAGSGSAAAPAGSAATPAAGSATAGSAAPAPTGPAAPLHDEKADFISAYATHKESKPIDPVEINFASFKVTKAKFDPKVVEGGTATIEVDLNSLKSPSEKRDAHLKSPAYIDISKFTTLTIDVDNVKKKDGATFTADANVKFHGVEKKLPVTFDVIDTQADSIRIKADQPFNRGDFQLGKDPSDKDETVSGTVNLKLQLTLKNT